MTVNHCFEILLRKWMGFSWRESLEKTLPPRKWMSIDEWNQKQAEKAERRKQKEKDSGKAIGDISENKT